MGLSSTASSADRLVLSQPLTFVGSDGTTRYNKRKYDQMPRTLYLSGRLNELNKMAFFNYLWLYNKSKALSIQHIIATFALNPGTESNLVKGALQACQPVILKNMNNMAAELTGRLLTYYASHPNIRHLIQQCDVEGLQHSALVPAFPYHQVPGGPLQHTLESPTPLQFFQLLGSDSRYLLAKERSSQNILVFDLATGEWKYDIQASAGDMHLTPDGSMIVLLDHVTEMSVKIHRSDTGKYVGQLIPLNHTTGETSEKYKLGRMSLSNEFLCIIATFEKSYLCIASVNECKFIEVVNLNGKASVCTITPDSRFVFTNSAETLMSYDLFTLEHVCSLPLEHRPNHVVFTREGHRGFVSNLEENVITVLHAKEGYVDLTYKISLTELLKGDQISDLVVSHNEKYLLVRGNSNLVIYGVKNEKVLSCFGRPSDTPVQFKLPQRSLTDLNFTQAKFSQDDQYVLATIFRNIYIIDVLSGNLVTKLQSPMGIITSLLLPDKRKQIVTHIENSDVIHVWNLDDAIKHVDTLDRLTGRIQEVLVTKDNTVSFVRCHNSDEVGVIDMSTGQLCDLLTHESPLTGLSITTDGRYAFVSVQPKRPGITNKIWHMEERKIIHEFGEVGGYSVPLHNVSTIISVCQKEINFKAPYYISLFKFEEDRVVEVQCDLTLNFVLSKPFVTKEDRYLIVLTADEYNEYKAEYNSPAICAFSLENDFAVASYSPADLRSCVNVKRMLDVRPHESNPYAVIVLYSCAAEEDEYNGVSSGYTSGIGFLILDVCSGAVIHVCDTFFPPDVDLSRILINQDVTLCMDAQSHIYDITTGFWKCQLVPTGTCPQRFALNGKAVIYYEDQEVYVIRVEDGKEIARCDVHMPITCVEVCHDQRTIVIGCSDGAVSAYVLIDERYDNAKEIVKTIPSRQLPLSTDIDGRTSRSWDKVESSAPQTPIRLPSALSLGQSEKEMLRKIKPVDRIRPQSDTLIYLNARSKTCSVM
ncbi:NACHT and WD repeat domain-containing protein 2-like [Lingula anatina]|uniref:NACHT and WD repeat domain-containing protein 2-like n=1 Tax=Lingula anatina TaxID=7574 RepID=A0A1S3KA54_LINAN|nr:NACHT and WD repeat domain-containing protein 2-like [Lingula anatina]|eukprot:XP_013419382.1 NACHT and WD repeat domain-containing protein 2-like [Lingula anatina]